MKQWSQHPKVTVHVECDSWEDGSEEESEGKDKEKTEEKMASEEWLRKKAKKKDLKDRFQKFLSTISPEKMKELEREYLDSDEGWAAVRTFIVMNYYDSTTGKFKTQQSS